jgi:arabinofuranosyltransferase
VCPDPATAELECERLIARHLELREVASERGFTRVRLLPRTQERTEGPLYAVGHLLFE